MIDEEMKKCSKEIEELLDDEESVETENVEVEETKEEKIKLDFSLDPVERLKQELEAAKNDFMANAIGQYVLNEFATNEPLKNAYKDRKITLEAIIKYANSCAAKQLNNKNGAIEDKVVFGWVIHYIQDEEVKISAKDSYEIKLTKEDKEKAKEEALKKYEAEELAKLKKKQEREEKAKQKAIEKEKKKYEESGQMQLFDW